MVFNLIYRFGPYFISPVIAGLDKISDTEYKPVIVTYDSIGYREHSDVFEVAGTGHELLLGICETFYKPDLEPEQLFETISNCLLSDVSLTLVPLIDERLLFLLSKNEF